MRITGDRADGEIGDVVTLTFRVYTGGAARYQLMIPLARGGAQYLDDCPNHGEPQGYCFVTFTAAGRVDERSVRFRILQRGTVNVPVVVAPEAGRDPRTGNNTASGKITGRMPYDLSLSAKDATGKVGDVVTVPVTVHNASTGPYLLIVPRDAEGVEYLGNCLSGMPYGDCIDHFEAHDKVTRVHHLKFKIIKAGATRITIRILGKRVEDPDPRDNDLTITITDLSPDDGQGGGDGDPLPTTGAPVAAVASGGAALLATGTLLLLAARRRRTSSVG